MGIIVAAALLDANPTPSASSHLTAYHGQSAPLVMLLATYDSSEYSSFAVSSDISIETTVSAIVWIVKSIQPIRNTYEETVVFQDARNIQLYALIGSFFQINFAPLDGPVTANATVEFRKYNGSGHPGELFASQSVGPSMKRQSVNYTSVEPGFIEFRLVNSGLNGSFVYNFTINELNISSLKKSDYKCTLNSINRDCKHSSVYSTNNLLASVTFDHDYIQGYPTFNITLTNDMPLMPLVYAFVVCMLLLLFVLGIITTIVLLSLKKKVHMSSC